MNEKQRALFDQIVPNVVVAGYQDKFRQNLYKTNGNELVPVYSESTVIALLDALLSCSEKETIKCRDMFMVESVSWNLLNERYQAIKDNDEHS